jgi:hypothetical protein
VQSRRWDDDYLERNYLIPAIFSTSKMERLSRPIVGNRVLLFGPQVLSFDQEEFRRIRSALLINPEEYQWIIDTIHGFSEWLDVISQKIPQLQVGKAYALQQSLIDWIQSGQFPPKEFIIPNVFLNPLVVISQLTQYTKYLQCVYPGDADPHKAAAANSKGETVGLCVGLLSAAAVSSSSCRKEFQTYGAVALRIALLSGLLVDAVEIHERSTSLAAAWNSTDVGKEVTRIMKDFSDVSFHGSQIVSL